jgi:DNA ligase 1
MTEVQDQKPLPSLKREEFLALFSPEIHDKIQAKALESGIEGIFAIQGAELYTGPGAGEMVGIQYGPISTFKFSDLHLDRLVPSPRGSSLMYSMIAHCPRSEFEAKPETADSDMGLQNSNFTTLTTETGRCQSKTPNMEEAPKPESHHSASEHTTGMHFTPGAQPTIVDDVEMKRVWPMLYKKTTSGKTQEWEIWVARDHDGSGVIYTRYGLQDGKKQEQTDTVTTGKNLGKKNATTAYEQACLEAEAEWKKQLERKGYGRDVEQSATTRGASPMLAHPLDKVKPDQIDWTHAWAQPKLDGFRCIIDFAGGGLTMRSREGKPIAADMSHIGNALTAALKNRQVPNRFSIDGELYRHRTFRTDKPLGEATKEEKSQHFQDLASAIKKTGPFTPLVELHVYDVMDPYPFKLRTKWVHETLANIPSIVLVETTQVQGLDSVMAYQGACLIQGYEGAMLRHGATQPYDFGKRSKHLLKVKTFKDDEFNVYDVREGRGTHKGMAIFICETEAGAIFEVTAPGTHWQKQQYWLNKPQCIGHKLTVKFFEYTGGDAPVPRFPVALRFREGDPFDMPPEPETQK